MLYQTHIYLFIFIFILGGLKQQVYFLTVLEAGNPRSRCSQGRCPMRAFPSDCRQPPSCFVLRGISLWAARAGTSNSLLIVGKFLLCRITRCVLSFLPHLFKAWVYPFQCSFFQWRHSLNNIKCWAVLPYVFLLLDLTRSLLPWIQTSLNTSLKNR